MTQFRLSFNSQLLNALALVQYFRLIFNLITAESYEFILLFSGEFIELAVASFKQVNIFEGPLVLGLEVSVEGVHVIEFLFEFEPELDLLLVSLDLLGEFLFDLAPEELLLEFLLLELVLLLLQCVKGVLELFLVVV